MSTDEKVSQEEFEKTSYKMKNIACSSNLKYWTLNDDVSFAKA